MKERTVNACLTIFIIIASMVILSMIFDLVRGAPSV